MPKANVLLVEDNKGQAGIIKDYLEKNGYNVVVAGDGMSAFKAAKAKGISMTKTSRHDTTWQGVMPAGLAAASLVVGGTIGTPAGWAAGGLGVLGTALPYFGNRLKERRSAAYLFVLARRRRH